MPTSGAVDLLELQSLLDRNPYSHVVRLAYLQVLRDKGDDRLERALDEAAVHVPDRKRLYHYMEEIGARPIPELPVVFEKQEENTASSVPEVNTLQRQYLTEAVQSSILLEVSDDSQTASEEETTVDTPEEVKESAPPVSFLDFIAGEAGAPSPKVLKLNEDVVDSFLKNKVREKVEFFDPERMARKSLDDKGGAVSDTLARIYMNQGNLDKALSAYEQLILIYPEKSGYFAARIQKVKDLMSK